MSSSRYDPRAGIDFDVDYYAVLGIKRGTLPYPKTNEEKRRVEEFLSEAFHRAAKVAHPDGGGTFAQFRLVVQAHTFLSDPIRRRVYDSGGDWQPQIVEDDTGFKVDWEKLGTYRQGTLADTTGYGLCLTVRERIEDLKLAGGFLPQHENDNYEWDWAILDAPIAGAKLSLSIVQDADDVLALTSGEAIEKNLPFKIYFCIPRASLYFARDEKEVIVEDGMEFSLQGRLRGAAYADYNLLETTSLEEARAYTAPGGGMERDMRAFHDGTLVSKQRVKDKDAEQSQWMSSKDIKRVDADVIRQILRSKSVKLVRDEHAADFLTAIPDNTYKLTNNYESKEK